MSTQETWAFPSQCNATDVEIRMVRQDFLFLLGSNMDLQIEPNMNKRVVYIITHIAPYVILWARDVTDWSLGSILNFAISLF